MHRDVQCTPYATYSRDKTGDVITFTHFEEGNLLSETQNLLSETRDDTENGNESDDYSNIPPLISEEETGVLDSGDAYDDEIMSTSMLEDIHNSSKSHLSIKRREAL